MTFFGGVGSWDVSLVTNPFSFGADQDHSRDPGIRLTELLALRCRFSGISLVESVVMIEAVDAVTCQVLAYG